MMRVLIRALAASALTGLIGMIPNLAAAHAAAADPPYGVQVQCGGGVFSLAPDSVIPGGSTSNDFNQLVPYSQRINASCAQSVSGFGAGAAASGLANLATGALHASASASHDFIQIENGAIISTGFAQTAPGFQDQLTFTGPTDPFLATFSLRVTGHISGVSSSTAGAFTPAYFAAVLQLSFAGSSPLPVVDSSFSGHYVNDFILVESSTNAEAVSLDPANLNIIEHFSARVFPDIPYFLDAALMRIMINNHASKFSLEPAMNFCGISPKMDEP